MNGVFYYFAFALLAFVGVRFLARFFKKGSSQKRTSDFELLEIQVPKNEEEGGEAQGTTLGAEGMFASLHGLLKEDYANQEHFSFEMAFSSAEGIRFYVAVPHDILKFVESQIYAQYPKAVIRVTEDYTDKVPFRDSHDVVTLVPNKKQFFPIKTFRELEVDSLSAVTSSLSELQEGESVWLQFVVMPSPDNWQDEGYGYVDSVRAGKDPFGRSGMSKELTDLSHNILTEFKEIMISIITGFFTNAETKTDYSKPSLKPVDISPTQDLELKAIENKLSMMGYKAQIRIMSSAETPERINSNKRSLIASFNQFYTAHTNSFRVVEEGPLGFEDYKNRTFDPDKAHVLTIEEMATLYHFPSSELGTPNISWLYSKKSEPPSTLPVDNCTYIGETIYRSKKVRFGLKDGDDRLRHMYLIGKSGTGKSTLLENMATQDIQKGFGVGVLDPHGETIEKILERIPDNRMDDVVLVDPSDTERPVGLNLLEMDDVSQKNLMASALVAAIKKQFDYSWGPRLEYMLNYCLLTLLEVPGTTMLGITRLLEDDNYLRYILHFVKDPMVQKFWDSEYKAMKGNQKLVTEAIAPIQNKVNRFLASTTIRNILGQKKSTIDLADIMNNKKILLINLSKGKIGDDNANLLGALLVSRIQFMALQRANIPYEQRVPFYLYVDEFQNFATGSFETILSESRKYKLGLYLTHQYTAQLPEELLKAVFGNVGTIATFSLGAPDARALTNEFAPYFDETDIISLERFHMYIKLMIDGMTSLPFSARILLPWDPETCIVPKSDNKQRVIEMSRQKYGSDRAYVEEKVGKWLETRFDKGMAIALENRSGKEVDSSV
ncbi:MAG: DUF87 domain-containing protein [Patescibacteria group bacterium]|jgi:hypothetical protein